MISFKLRSHYFLEGKKNHSGSTELTLEMIGMRKLLALARNQTFVKQPEASHFTDRATALISLN
jgi:hypothetical protein